MQMELQFEVVPLQPVRFIDIPQPMRRIVCAIEADLCDEITAIAQAGNLEISMAVHELLTLAIRHYKTKHTNDDKTFYCQVCGKERKTRYMHRAVVFSEEYKFCEDCFFADKHKQFAITQIARM